jgi:hypothetical protein
VRPLRATGEAGFVAVRICNLYEHRRGSTVNRSSCPRPSNSPLRFGLGEAIPVDRRLLLQCPPIAGLQSTAETKPRSGAGIEPEPLFRIVYRGL